MPSCPKCGRIKVRKRKDGRRKCKRCGYLPSNQHLMRGGAIKPKPEERDHVEN